ncbi:PAS domain-containing protein, partial [Stutzerimonas balearica]|uniref:PAS domain-containing protein n=1 Tax=Stutzerimonas balearica TaxID=74829 RepID=UPI0028A5E592
MCSAPSDTGGGQTRPAPAGQPSSLAETHRLAVQRHTPASMLIDRNGQILHVSERAGRYLRHPAGEPPLLLTQLVLPELRLELRLALLDAVRRGESVEAKRVHVLRDGEWVWVSISVRPVEPGQSDHLLVLFDEIQARRELPSPPDQQDGLMRQLEAELQQTQDQLLQATAQARGAAAPSLAADAPLPAAIDNDLQAANERLRQQLEQTRQSADELQNLIAAVDIATLLVDSDLRVTWCSPRLREMLALAAGDIERSLER